MKRPKHFFDQQVDVFYDEVRGEIFFMTYRINYIRLHYPSGVKHIFSNRNLPRKRIHLDGFIEDQRIGEKDLAKRYAESANKCLHL